MIWIGRSSRPPKIEFDWPEFLPVERIKAGIIEIALGFLLFAGLVAFCGFHFFS
jgi:hypothetical protein